MEIADIYNIYYGEKQVGTYQIYNNDTVCYDVMWGCPWDIGEELKALGLDKQKHNVKSIKFIKDLINDKNRVPGRKRVIYTDGTVTAERVPEHSGETFSVYRRWADKDEPDYSPLPHDAPHREGPHTPEGMREWASHYSFNKMDDGTFEAELDEQWCWGGGHNDGGTIHTEIPEEWQELPYDEFLERVVTLAAAAHYGFTPEILKSRKGLKEFFGYTD